MTNTEIKTITYEIFYGVSSPWAALGASQAYGFGEKYGLTVHLRPIVVIQNNGGITLAQRPQARLDYHALDLRRTADRLGIPLLDKPKHYASGSIVPAAQSVIRVQQSLGHGADKAIAFSWAIQQSLWIEDGNVYSIAHLRELGRRVGLEEGLVLSAINDTDDPDDAGVQEYRKNLRDAEDLGMWVQCVSCVANVFSLGTPNYVINGEIFWGRDRLDDAEARIQELLNNGYRPA